MNKETGGPAFPYEERDGDGAPYRDYFGMTLRDYFAAKAMQNFFMSEQIHKDAGSAKDWLEGIAEASYDMADAMIKVRGEVLASPIIKSYLEKDNLEENLYGLAIKADNGGQPEQEQSTTCGEPVAWPCVIETADFEEDTVTLKMQSKDYSVGVGLHWLSTTPYVATPRPQRSEASKPLTDVNYVNACVSYRHDFGLMTQEQREKLMFQAREWARAFGMSEAAHGIRPADLKE